MLCAQCGYWKGLDGFTKVQRKTPENAVRSVSYKILDTTDLTYPGRPAWNVSIKTTQRVQSLAVARMRSGTTAMMTIAMTLMIPSQILTIKSVSLYWSELS